MLLGSGSSAVVQSTRMPVQRLLTEAGLPPIPSVDGAIAIGDNYYCTSVRDSA